MYISNAKTEYNKEGKRIKVIESLNNDSQNIRKFFYDDSGTVKKEVKLQNGEDTVFIKHYQYKRDTSILKEMHTYYRNRRSVELEKKYRYIEEQNLIEKITESPLIGKQKIIYQYDRQGHLIKEIHYHNTYKHKIIKYNDKFHPIFIKYYDSNNGDLMHESKMNYKYDNHGNWITKKVYVRMVLEKSIPFDLVSVIDRKIEYYN